MPENDAPESVAWKAVNALIEDAQAKFKGERQEAFAWAIYNAVRQTAPWQLRNIRELLLKYEIEGCPAKEFRQFR